MSGTSLTKAVAVGVWALFGVGIVSADEKQSPKDEVAPQKEMRSAKTPLRCDYQIATWLAIESELYAEISEFAGERAAQASVRQFAQGADKTHRELVAKLHDPMEKMAHTKFDVGKVLKEITQRWEESYGNNRRVLGFRGRVQPPDEEQSDQKAEARLADVRKQIAQQREVVNKTREKASETRSQSAGRGAQTEDNTTARAEELKKLHEAREALRELRRERQAAQRDLLAAQTVASSLSERVPHLLTAISDAVQKTEGSTQGLWFTDIQQQVAKRTAESIRNDLQQKSGEDFDRAYLAFEVFGQLRMIDTLEVAKQHASQELRPVLESSIATAQNQLRQARELLQHVGGSKG